MSTLLHIILHTKLNNRDLGFSKSNTIAGGLSGRGLRNIKGPTAGDSILSKCKDFLYSEGLGQPQSKIKRYSTHQPLAIKRPPFGVATCFNEAPG